MEDGAAKLKNNLGEQDEDDVPVLSFEALQALKEFLAEQNQVTIDGDAVTLVAEDWRLSQFWYEPQTAQTLAEEISTLCQLTHSPVSCISCPTLYSYLKKINPSIKAQLLEYDRRFEQYGDEFTFYDYNHPKDLPSVMKKAYRVIVADPPYLSEECLEKVAESIAFLSHPEQSYILLLTGEVQREKASEILGLYPCGFRPQHSSKLGNEFRLFTNYDPGTRLGGWKTENLSHASINC